MIKFELSGKNSNFEILLTIIMKWGANILQDFFGKIHIIYTNIFQITNALCLQLTQVNIHSEYKVEWYIMMSTLWCQQSMHTSLIGFQMPHGKEVLKHCPSCSSGVVPKKTDSYLKRISKYPPIPNLYLWERMDSSHIHWPSNIFAIDGDLRNQLSSLKSDIKEIYENIK